MKNQSVELTEAPKGGKFRALIVKIGKRNLIIAAAVVLIGAAVVLNWILFAKPGDDGTGYPGYDTPSGLDADAEGKDTPTADTAGTYFSATQVSRQKARDEALEVLQSVVDNAESSEVVKSEALAGITAIAAEIEKEANIEALITAKGFENCVAVLNGENASIIVSAEDLQPAQIAQINTIVYEQTGILPAGITILNK